MNAQFNLPDLANLQRIWTSKYFQTRKHSNRMHTACLLTDDGGGWCPGVCVRGCVRGLCVHTPRPRITHKHLDPEAPPDQEAHPLDPQADTTPPRQIPAKTLPCPKLRLRAVIMQWALYLLVIAWVSCASIIPSSSESKRSGIVLADSSLHIIYSPIRRERICITYLKKCNKITFWGISWYSYHYLYCLTKLTELRRWILIKNILINVSKQFFSIVTVHKINHSNTHWHHFYHPRMRVGNVFGHVCLSVCLSVCLCVCVSVCSGYNFWTTWHRNFIFGMQVHLDLGQVWVSRSLGQGQGHMRKMIVLLISTS